MLKSLYRLPFSATLGVALLATSVAVAQTQQDQPNPPQDESTSDQESRTEQQRQEADRQAQQAEQQRQQNQQQQNQQQQDREQQDRQTQQSRQRDQQTQRDNYQTDDQVRRDQTGREIRRDERSMTRSEEYDVRQGQQGRQQADAPAGLGVSVVDGSRGVVVREVAPGSPAEQAGIERGDEIIAVDGRRINTGDQLVQVISQHDPGTDVELSIDRDGQEETLMANLETRRQALQFENRPPQDRWMGGGRDSQFARGSSPPWDADDVQRHVDDLERQVSRLQRDIEDLRRMLRDDPGRRQFDQSTTSTQRSSQDQRSQSTRSNRMQSQGSQQQDFERDQQNRARPDYDQQFDQQDQN